MHGRFTAATAVRVARAARAVRPGLDRGAGAARQPRRAPPGPRRDLAADGHRRAGARPPEFRELFEGGLVDIVQADLTHFGGLTGLRKLAGWADAYDLLLAPHNVCGPVGTAANLHFAVATRTTRSWSTSTTSPTPGSAPVDAAPRVDPADGCFALPTAPGLGVRLDREAAGRHPGTGVHFNLVREGWERRDARTHGTPPPARTAPASTTTPAAPRTAASGPRREASSCTGDHRWVIARSDSSSSSGPRSHGSRAA